MKAHKDIDSYIKAAQKEAQPLLKQMREAICEAAPGASEAISYGIPTFKMGGNLVHFGAFKTHVSFFSTSSGVAAFAKELSKYKLSKGTVQFPLNQKLPLPLIKKIVRFRVKETQAKQVRPKGTRATKRP